MSAKKGNGQTQEKQDEPQVKQAAKTMVLKTRWKGFSDVPTLYANQLLVTHANQNEFFLFFGQVVPPAVLDPKDLPSELDVVPIAKIVVSPENMLNFSKAIATNVENYKATRKSAEKE